MVRVDKYVCPIGCLLAVLSVAPVVARAQCLGDFNGDGKVSVSELVTGVDNALDGCQVSGPRFVDNGDGTITDHKTGLMWEKKDNLNGGQNLSDPHDAVNVYTWTDAMSEWLSLINGSSADGTAQTGLGGHSDWRLPTSAELQTILLAPYPCGKIDPDTDSPSLFTALERRRFWGEHDEEPG